MRFWLLIGLLAACGSTEHDELPWEREARVPVQDAHCSTLGFLCYSGCSAEGRRSIPECRDGGWQCAENAAQLEQCGQFECTRSTAACCTWEGEVLPAHCDRTGQLPTCPAHSFAFETAGTCKVVPEVCRVESIDDLHGKACSPAAGVTRCQLNSGCSNCSCDCGSISGEWYCQCPEC